MLNLPLWIINLSGSGDCCVVEDDHETEILDHSGEYVVSHQYISNLTLNLRKNCWSDSWMPKKGVCLKCCVFFLPKPVIFSFIVFLAVGSSCSIAHWN
jgi:hypothetical protein